MVKLKMGVVLLVCMLAAVTLLRAADPAKPAATDATAPAAKPAPAASGVVVFKDPVTGKIRQPEPEEIRQLLRQSPGGEGAVVQGETVRQVRGPQRGVGMILPESTMVSIVVTKGPDGKLSSECVSGGQKAAEARVAAAAQSKKTKEASDVQ